MNGKPQTGNSEVVATWMFQACGGAPAFEVDVTAEDMAEMDRQGLVGGERRFEVWIKWIEEHPLTPAERAAEEAEWFHGLDHAQGCFCDSDDVQDPSPDVGVRNPNAYFASALRTGAEKVRNALEGDRNNTLFKVAASLFEVPARAGLLGFRAAAAAQEVEKVLFDAAVAAGLEEAEVEGTLRSARAAAGADERGAAKRKPETFW